MTWSGFALFLLVAIIGLWLLVRDRRQAEKDRRARFPWMFKALDDHDKKGKP